MNLKQVIAGLFCVASLSVGGLASAITIVPLETSEPGFIVDLDLSVDLQDIWAQDIDILLEHNGVSVHVYDASIDDSAAFDVLFDDEALSNAPKSGDVVGSFIPDNPLSAFDGLALAGTWNLILWDDIFPGDGTDLLAWSISGVGSNDIFFDFTIDGRGAVDVDTPSDVPEPSTIALLGLGLLGVTMARRREV